MRIRIRITNEYFFYLSAAFASGDILIAVFNPIISNIEKVILLSLALILGYYALNIKRMIDKHQSGHLLTIPRIHQTIINISAIVSLFLIIYYGDSTPSIF